MDSDGRSCNAVRAILVHYPDDECACTWCGYVRRYGRPSTEPATADAATGRGDLQLQDTYTGKFASHLKFKESANSFEISR